MSAIAPRVAAAIAALLIVLGAIALVYRSGSEAGGDKAQVKTERAHTEAVAEARKDERAAIDVTARIAAKTARADATTDKLLAKTIEDLRNALDQSSTANANHAGPGGGGGADGGDAASVGAAGGAAPAVRVDQLRDALNAGIARANRAADAADAAR